MHAALWDINFVPGLSRHPLPVPPLPPVPPSCFPNAVDVLAHLLSLLSFVITPWSSSIRCVSGFWITWHRVTAEPRKEPCYSSWSLRYRRLIGWGVSQANKPGTVMWLTEGRDRALQARHRLFQRNNLVPDSPFSQTNTNTCVMQVVTPHFVYGASLILQPLLGFPYVQPLVVH